MVAKNEAWYHQVDGCYREECALACDKMCKVSKKFDYRLDYGSVSFTDDRTHFGIYVGPF